MTETTLDDVRDRLVLAALSHIPFDGWSMKALRHAAEDAGLDLNAPDRAFPNGVTDAVEHFTDLGDRLMLADLAERGLDGLSVQARVEEAVRVRLQRWAPHQEAVRRALTVYSLPQNLGLAARATWRTVDLIWKATGDRSADFNWYTKRASLAAVYSATVLYWLDDQTEDSEATWDFLHRRMTDVVNGIKMRREVTGRLQKTLERLPNPFGYTLRRPGRKRRA